MLSGIFISFLALLLLLSLIWPNQGEMPQTLFDTLGVLFGWGRYLIPVIMIALGLYLVFWGMEQRPTLPTVRLTGLGILILIGEAFATLSVLMRDASFADVWQVGEAGRGGGYLGSILAFMLIQFAGNLGAIFILVFMLLGVLTSFLSNF